ncbi:hypothetical protein [Candidatus Finniella inopinata]|uniref:Uncharacterized protein n=1 Tax=Candidatus Finniella inopinata TaxID=1696036 RepID=A0A4Q7DM80_9PROT|nr:hypothetical protein [Candidatus Finniella inopinata]RZI45896.1 hypothetical protein EQU50_05555 [Candidatus Finniella inopinata]
MMTKKNMIIAAVLLLNLGSMAKADSILDVSSWYNLAHDAHPYLPRNPCIYVANHSRSVVDLRFTYSDGWHLDYKLHPGNNWIIPSGKTSGGILSVPNTRASTVAYTYNAGHILSDERGQPKINEPFIYVQLP